MILRAPNWSIPFWMERVLQVVCLTLFSPLIAMMFVIVGAMWVKRKLLGPTRDWQSWFAWRPVRLGGSVFGEVRWLETVERQSYDVMCDTYYRANGSDWEHATW